MICLIVEFEIERVEVSEILKDDLIILMGFFFSDDHQDAEALVMTLVLVVGSGMPL